MRDFWCIGVYKASIWISSTVISWHLNLERHLESFKWIYFEWLFWIYVKPTKLGETKFSSILQFEKRLCHICKLFVILLIFNRQNLLNSCILGECRLRKKNLVRCQSVNVHVLSFIWNDMWKYDHNYFAYASYICFRKTNLDTQIFMARHKCFKLNKRANGKKAYMRIGFTSSHAIGMVFRFA